MEKVEEEGVVLFLSDTVRCPITEGILRNREGGRERFEIRMLVYIYIYIIYKEKENAGKDSDSTVLERVEKNETSDE